MTGIVQHWIYAKYIWEPIHAMFPLLRVELSNLWTYLREYGFKISWEKVLEYAEETLFLGDSSSYSEVYLRRLGGGYMHMKKRIGRRRLWRKKFSGN